MSGRLRGVIAAIITPITADGEPDFDRFERAAGYLLDNDGNGGCDGLNVLGTTGEATSFSLAQRAALMRHIARSPLDQGRMMVGTGAASVSDAAELAALAAELGFSGALVLPPFYYKGVSDAGIAGYFERIVARLGDHPLPLYLYNFPALSGVPYTLELIQALLDRFGQRIAGLKDSSGDLDYARAVAALPAGLDVFPSNEACLIEARGGTFAGCISATANCNAALCRRGFHDGDAEALATAVAIRKLFDGKPLVPGVKALLAHILDDPAMAAPLPPFVPFSDAHKRAVIDAYEGLVA